MLERVANVSVWVLSHKKISKTNYGDPNKYMVIFEANMPMPSDPNRIYPGQVLRIPPLQ